MIALAALLGVIAPAAAAIDAPASPVRLLTIPATHRLIEGIATDGVTFWFSSVADREILVWRRGRPIRAMPMPPATARPLGMAYDGRRRWIWIATDCPKIAVTGDCAGGALVAIDRAGRLRRRLAPEGEAHFGDVSVAAGVVHVGDSANGAVYRCRDACTALQTIIPPGVDRSAQSSAAYDDGRLMVADYGSGMISVDAQGARTPVLREDGRTLRGIDGFARRGDRFVGVQNSETPGLVLAFRLAPDGRHVADLTILGGGADFPEPTQVAIAHGRAYVVADAQWSAYAGTVASLQHATPIMRMDVRKRASRRGARGGDRRRLCE